MKWLGFGVYALCALLIVVFLTPVGGWKALDVLTGSMRPAIQPGSLVFIHKVPLNDIRVGDIITYTDPHQLNVTITHRVIRIARPGGVITFTVKGDANPQPDPSFQGGYVDGKVEAIVPAAGKYINYLHNPYGLAALVMIPGLIVIWFEIERLRGELRKYPATEEEVIDDEMGLLDLDDVEPEGSGEAAADPAISLIYYPDESFMELEDEPEVESVEQAVEEEPGGESVELIAEAEPEVTSVEMAREDEPAMGAVEPAVEDEPEVEVDDAPVVEPKKARPVRSLDGMKRLVLVGLAFAGLAMAVGHTFAAQVGVVALKANTFTVASTSPSPTPTPTPTPCVSGGEGNCCAHLDGDGDCDNDDYATTAPTPTPCVRGAEGNCCAHLDGDGDCDHDDYASPTPTPTPVVDRGHQKDLGHRKKDDIILIWRLLKLL